MARPHALVVLALCAHAAHAEVIDLPDTRAELALDTRAWTPVAIADAPGVVAGYTTAHGEVLAITRAQVPNPDAWRAKTRDAYVDRIERGITGAGYRRTRREIRELAGVPVVDLEATGPRGPLVVRILLFRTYALSLAIQAPHATARAIAVTFVPPPPRPEGSP